MDEREKTTGWSRARPVGPYLNRLTQSVPEAGHAIEWTMDEQERLDSIGY